MADKQKLVLVPGLVCDAAVWGHQTTHLAEIAEISVPPVVDGKTMAEMAWIALAGAPLSFALAGFSMGGWATEYFGTRLQGIGEGGQRTVWALQIAIGHKNDLGLEVYGCGSALCPGWTKRSILFI